jgi:hypothetical protein
MNLDMENIFFVIFSFRNTEKKIAINFIIEGKKL